MMCWAWHGYSLDQPTGWVVMVWGKGGGGSPRHHACPPSHSSNHGPGPASKPQQREGRGQDPSWS